LKEVLNKWPIFWATWCEQKRRRSWLYVLFNG